MKLGKIYLFSHWDEYHFYRGVNWLEFHVSLTNIEKRLCFLLRIMIAGYGLRIDL